VDRFQVALRLRISTRYYKLSPDFPFLKTFRTCAFSTHHFSGGVSNLMFTWGKPSGINESGEGEDLWLRQDSDKRGQGGFPLLTSPCWHSIFSNCPAMELQGRFVPTASSGYGSGHGKGLLANRNSGCVHLTASQHLFNPTQSHRHQSMLDQTRVEHARW
jgi:hypothetical protein